MEEANPSQALSRRAFVQAGAGAFALAVLGRPAQANAATVSPRGPAARTVSLNQNWLFGGEYVDGADQPGFDDGHFDTVTLPHTVTHLSWREWDPDSWEKVWIYRRRFDIPDELAGLRLFLDLDGMMTGSTVTLNGHVLGDHLGGYLPFTYEIGEHTKARDNLLAVALDSRFNIDVPPDRPAPSPSTSVDFWQPGGIYRQVWLRAVPQVFLADVFAKPVDVLDATRRQVEVECTVDAAQATRAGTRIVVDLRDGDRKIASASVPVTAGKSGQMTVTATLTGLGDITLWDIDNPKLYDVVATLMVDDTALHDYQVRIGFREAAFRLDGFFLNGRRVKLFGVNRHQFFPFAGGAMPDRVQRKDAEILRQDLNCNMVRCSHYPQAEAFFDACDEVGLMVWEEAPGWGYLGDDDWKALALRDVGDTVRRDRNHPSIIIWGARLNETADDVPFYTKTRDLAHSLDDSRPTVGAMLSGKHGSTGYVQDVFSQNDYSSSTGPDGEKQPDLMPPRTDRPYMISEAVGTLSGPAKFYRRTDDQDAQQGMATAHGRVHSIAASNDRYCGVLAWSGYDYPSGSGNQFQGVKYTGVVDLFRVPKPGAAIYQSQVDPEIKPVIQPAFYWDFGPTSPVTSLGRAMICANLDRLEVYVDGAHHATATPDTTSGYGYLRYPPSFVDFGKVDGSSHPELRIDGYLGDNKVASRTFSSDPSTDALSLLADDAELTGDGADATRVVFRAVDKHGAPRPYVGGQVELSVSGPAMLLGDNPFPFAEVGGVGAVWLRTLPNSPGTVTIRATHPTLGSATATVRVRQATPGGPPAPYGTLVPQAPDFVPAGSTMTVTGAFTNNGNPNLGQVALTIKAPDGWTATATTPTTFTGVGSGQSVQAGWRVSVPADAPPAKNTLTIQAAYSANDTRGVTTATVDVQVPYASLAKARNNAGISDDGDVDAADFDGVGNSYSLQALTAAGLSPGATVHHDGLVFTWPDTSAGDPDNVIATGRTVEFSGSGTKLGFLGAASSSTVSGKGTIHYTDGSASDFTLTFGDWWAGPATGDEVVATMPYENSKGTGGRPRGRRDQTVYVYYTNVPVTAGKTVAAVTLPTGGTTGPGRISGIHVFALAIG